MPAISGNIFALGQTLQVSTVGCQVCSVAVESITGVTLVMEGSVSGNFNLDAVTLNMYPMSASAVAVQSVTTASSWSAICAGFQAVRVRVSVAGTKAFVILYSDIGFAGNFPTVQAVTLAANQSVIATAATTGGATIFKVQNLAATVTAVKASGGTLYGVQVLNTSGATAFVQIFNVATGGVTLATTVPDLELQVATAASISATLPLQGVNFGTAISIASTTAEFGSVGSAAGVQVFAQYA